MKIQYSSFISADKAAERVSNAKKYFISSLLDEIKSPFTNSDFEVSNNNIINNRGLGRGWRRKKTKRLSIDEKKRNSIVNEQSISSYLSNEDLNKKDYKKDHFSFMQNI